jgi:hypothetical protein
MSELSDLGKNVKEKFSELGNNPEDNFDLSTIQGVLNMILSAFKLPETPVGPLPPPLIMVGAPLRPGVSSKEIASRIITRQSEAGLPVGDVFADGPNTTEAMLAIQSEEIINALLNESVVNVVIPPGIGIVGFGVTSGGQQVVVQGFTTTMGIGNGIIR